MKKQDLVRECKKNYDDMAQKDYLGYPNFASWLLNHYILTYNYLYRRVVNLVINNNLQNFKKNIKRELKQNYRKIWMDFYGCWDIVDWDFLFNYWRQEAFDYSAEMMAGY